MRKSRKVATLLNILPRKFGGEGGAVGIDMDRGVGNRYDTAKTILTDEEIE
jgi:hypothetical protein